MRLLACALLVLCSLLPFAAQARDYDSFRRLPVLEDGRLKPLDSFAENMKVRLSGSSKGAVEWLAQTLFDPAAAAAVPVFRLANAHVRAMLELPEQPGKLYSLEQLAPGLARTAEQAEALSQRKPADMTADERALLELHTHVLLYNQLLQAFSPLLPLPGPHDRAATYLEAQRNEQELTQQLKAELTPEQVAKPETMTPAQQDLALYLMTLDRLRRAGQNNMMLRIVPAAWAQQGEWLSPWQVLLAGL